MLVMTLSGLEIKGAGQLAPKTTHKKTISVLNNTRIMQRYTQGHFHFKLEKKFPQGAKKKYPCIEIIYDFFCQKYSKLHGKKVGIDLNLVL